MSIFKCPIVEISNIKIHPDADRLEIVEIFGWQVVTGKGVHKPGDKAVFVPIDSSVPQWIAEKEGITNYLKYGVKVHAAQLRGEYSYGFLLKASEYNLSSFEIGDDVSKELGIVKHLTPDGDDNYAEDIGMFTKYTDIQYFNNYTDVFCFDDIVVGTEKIHGENFRCGWIDGTWCVGSFEKNLLEGDSNHWKASRIYDLKSILKEGEIIYGEVFGPKIKKLNYGRKSPDILFFDMKRNGQYLNWNEFVKFTDDNKLPRVPLLAVDKWDDGSKFKQLSIGKTIAGNGCHIREGIVVKSATEKNNHKIGRVILKLINPDYLVKNYDA